MGTPSLSKILLTASLFIGACNSNDPGVKVWQFEPEEAAKSLKGWYRANGEEVKTFGESDVKYGVNASDMEFILQKLELCKDPKGNSYITKQEQNFFLRALLGDL